MGEGLPRNVVTSAGEIKASKDFSFESQSLFSAFDLNYQSLGMDVLVIGIAGKNELHTKRDGKATKNAEK